MPRSVLVLIQGDPGESHRPAEAIRIALGLISGDHAVRIVLMNRAPLLLGEDAEDLVDGELLMKYLPTLPELGQKFHVEEDAWKDLNIDPAGFEVIPVTAKQIGEMVSDAEVLISF